MSEEADTAAARARFGAWVKRHRWLLALGAVVAALYLPGLSGEFVLDDRTYFLDNDLLPALKPWNLKAILLYPSNYWWDLLPVRDLLYVLQYNAFGVDTAGYHVVSLLLYLATGYAAYRLLAVLYRDLLPEASTLVWPALVATAVFLLHPAHVEAVAYISGQKDLLFALFSLLTLHVGYTAFRDSRLSRPGTLVALVGCYYVALLSKETAAGTGLVLAVMWFLAVSRPVRHKLLAVAFWGVVNIPAMFWLLYANRFGSEYRQDTALVALPMLERLVVAIRILGAHAALALWPHPLSFGHPFERVVELDVWLGLGLAVLAAFVAATARRKTLLTISVVLFIAYMLPALQIVRTVMNAVIYDRYLHLPLLGFAVVVERAYAWGTRRGPDAARLSHGLLVGYLVVLALLTHAHVKKFQSEVAMTRHVHTAYPGWSRAAFDYAGALIEAGRYEDALELVRTDPALADPAWVGGYFQGWAALEQGRPAEATGLLLPAAMQAATGGYYPFPNVLCAEAYLAQGKPRAARMMLQPVMTSTIYNPLEFYRAKTLLAQIQSAEAEDLTTE